MNSDATTIGVARLLNASIGRLQLAALNIASVSFVCYFNSSFSSFDSRRRSSRPRSSVSDVGDCFMPDVSSHRSLIALLSDILHGVSASAKIVGITTGSLASACSGWCGG